MFLSRIYIQMSIVLISCAALLRTVSIPHFHSTSDKGQIASNGSEVKCDNAVEDIAGDDATQDKNEALHKSGARVEEVKEESKSMFVGSSVLIAGSALLAGGYHLMSDNTPISEGMGAENFMNVSGSENNGNDVDGRGRGVYEDAERRRVNNRREFAIPSVTETTHSCTKAEPSSGEVSKSPLKELKNEKKEEDYTSLIQATRDRAKRNEIFLRETRGRESCVPRHVVTTTEDDGVSVLRNASYRSNLDFSEIQRERSNEVAKIDEEESEDMQSLIENRINNFPDDRACAESLTRVLATFR